MAMFICSDCGNRSTGGGDCSACGQGPLLDLGDPKVVTAIHESDVQRQLKRERLMRVVALPIATAPVLAIVFAAPWLLVLIPLPVPFGEVIKVIVAIVLVAFPVSKGFIRVFRTKPFLPQSDVQSASTADVAAAMRSGGTKGILVVGGILVGIGLLIAVGVGALRASERRARIRAVAAMSALRTCLLGDLDPGESVADRLRRLELSRGAVEPAADWPDRCARHGDALFVEMENEGATGRLKELLATKAGCDKGCQGDKLLASIQEIVTAGKSAWIDPDETSTEPLPDVLPPPVAEMHLLSTRNFNALAPIEIVPIDSTVLADGRAVILYRTPAATFYVCEMEPVRGRIACRSVPESIRVAVSTAKLARGEDEPVIYGITSAKVTGGRDALGNERDPDKKGEPQKTEVERGAFSVSTGARVPFFHGQSGQGRRNGVLVEGRGASAEIVVVKEGQEASRRTLGSSADPSGPWIVGDTLVFLGTDSGGERALFSSSALGKRVESAGRLSGYSSAAPIVCRSAEATALVFGDRHDTQVSFLGKSGLSKPVFAPLAVRVGEEPPPPVKKAPPPEPSASVSGEPAPPASASGRHDVAGPKDNPDPAAARQKALKDAAEFGLMGLLNSSAGGDPNAPASPFGQDIGSSFGAGGLGSTAGFGGLGTSRRSAAREPVDAPPEVREAMIDNAEVSCSGDTVTRTWVSEEGGDTSVHQIRCTAASCVHEMTKLRQLGLKKAWVVTTIGDKALLVFRGELGDLRMRMAPLAELSKAHDTVIMDSSDHGGPETGEPHVLVGRTSVTVLFRGEGLFGLRITADGKHAVVRRGQ